MEKYDYLEHVKEDVLNYIEENYENIKERFEDIDEAEETLSDILWYEDSVTGNASGSYTFSTWQAEENICHNLDLLQEVVEQWELPFPCNYLENPEIADVSIRCYLLNQAIREVLEEQQYFD